MGARILGNGCSSAPQRKRGPLGGPFRMSLAQALAEISRWAVVTLVLFAIQLIVPPLTILLLRRRFPQFDLL